MKKIVKSDITFLIALAFFAVVCFSRFWDEKLRKHIVLFDFMQEFEWAIIFTVVYFIVLFVFFVVCIANCEKKNRRNLYYLICFYSTFAFPMFLAAKYFGTVDIYAWMITWISGMLLISGRAEWLIAILCFVMSFISPMSVLTGGCITCVILVYKFLTQEKKKYLFYMFGSIVASVIGVLASSLIGTFSTDEQNVLPVEKFVTMILFLSPYIYIAVVFFVELIHKTKTVKRWSYFVFMIGILPSVIVYIGLEDYARVVFHVFSYVILLVIVYIVMNDKDVVWQLQRAKDFIKNWIPIPILVIAIPFLFMTLWIAGQQHLMKEVFVNK